MALAALAVAEEVQPPARSADSRCLTDDTLIALADQALRTLERPRVEHHLDGCGSCRRLAVEVIEPRTPCAGDGDDGLPPPAPGARLGRYRLERLIGVGAMGLVYSAQDERLGRRVALKVLRGARGPNATLLRARLEREAQVLAKLSHPNVLAIFDLQLEGQHAFTATELVEGGTLREWLAQGPRTPRELAGVFRQAAAALSAVHASGFVHRDFKPDNVLVDQSGRVVLADFGLAAPAGEIAPALERGAPLRPLRLTQTGALVGTPAYMSPEQLAGQPADARSDLFALCVALYEAASGIRPFAAVSVEELREQIARRRLRPPARPAPERLMAVARRGLEPDPARRFASAAELIAALRSARR